MTLSGQVSPCGSVSEMVLKAGGRTFACHEIWGFLLENAPRPLNCSRFSRIPALRWVRASYMSMGGTAPMTLFGEVGLSQFVPEMVLNGGCGTFGGFLDEPVSAEAMRN